MLEMAMVSLLCAGAVELSTLVGEQKVEFRGEAANGSEVMVAVDDKGEFSVLLASPNGKICLVANGSGWERIKKGKGY